MNTDTIRDDLAFLKGLAESGGRTQWTGGAVFVAGGMLYGLQCVVQWAQAIGLITMGSRPTIVFTAGITVAFLIALCIILVRNRKLTAQGISNKAFNAVFAATGLTNVVLIIIFASVAIPRQSIVIWELYPAALFALQGSAWYVAFLLRRKLWLVVVAGGWFASAIALGLLVGTTNYVLACGIALIIFMTVPGFYMMRLARQVA